MDYVDQSTTNDNKKKEQFNNTYRSVDVLIVDDIQFLPGKSGKPGTQEKFFNIFNQLLLSGKQIVLTSDKPTKDLKDIDNRLASRFVAGLNVEIRPPDLDLRKDIIRFKSKIENINLSDDIINYIAKCVTKSVRELEGTLIKIVAETLLGNRPLSLDLVKEIITGLASTPSPITMNEIIDKVCIQYNIKPELLETKTRKKEISLARQMSMYLIRKHTQLSLQTIGSRFGGRDHTTVIHSCVSIENYLATDSKVQEEFEILENIIKNR